MPLKPSIKTRAAGLLALAVLAALALGAAVYHRQIWAVLTEEGARDAFIGWVRASGPAGLGAMFALQVLQVVVAFLPGEPLELAAGLLYGTWGGLALCLAGILAGSAGVYWAARLLGARAVPEQKLAKYKFLRDQAHVEFALFLLFFIPGTPKDWLIYLGPFLPVRPRNFFLISTLARIPSILSSTFTAASFAAGNWHAAAAAYAVTGAVTLVCLWKEEAILAWLRARRRPKGPHGAGPGEKEGNCRGRTD